MVLVAMENEREREREREREYPFERRDDVARSRRRKRSGRESGGEAEEA